jgi:HD-GYP domain-containing protein (c-di-GMP phosphodiesterase class II)/DNA-binding CsgD family transcriptional regulator
VGGPAAGIRLTEALAPISLTTDLATGAGFEVGLRQCAVASAFAEQLGLGTEDRRTVHVAALLRSIGCTSHAPENAAMFGDDIAFEAVLHTLDPSEPATLAGFGAWAPPADRGALAARFAREAPTVGPRAARAGCETSAALCGRLGLAPAVATALTEVFERWDGLGLPDGVRGEAISLPGRVVVLAEQVVLAQAAHGPAGAVAEVARRGGGQLDPALAATFARDPGPALAPLEAGDALAEALAREPRPVARLPDDQVERLAFALAAVADLKGAWLTGHSPAVARLAEAAARLAGMEGDARRDLRIAAMLHDVGRAGVPSSAWDRPGPLGPAETERVRLHPYWTARVLERVPALARLAPVAGAHHERLDGSGYHRGAPGGQLSPAARLLAAADVLSACCEARPHRPAMTRDQAARILTAEVRAGRLDADGAGAVIEAAGLPRPRADWPAGLSTREVDVLRLAARGLSNKAIADDLVLSARTVQHHLASVYDKTGRRTRGGAALFAAEHGLLPASDGPFGR